MEGAELEELWRRKKTQTLRLTEVSDLTRQLAEAANRHDQVSFQVLLSMRADPLQQMEDMEAAIQNYLLQLPEPDAIRAQELLNGAAAETDAERPLSDQVGQYRRLLQSVITLDSQVSLLMGGDKSFYKLYRGRR